MTTPVLHQTPYGWLAVSPPEENLRFAVTAQTEADAAAKYAASLEKWRTAAAAAAVDTGAETVAMFAAVAFEAGRKAERAGLVHETPAEAEEGKR